MESRKIEQARHTETGRLPILRRAMLFGLAAALLTLASAPASAQPSSWLRTLEHIAAVTPEQIPDARGAIHAYPAPGAPPEDRSLRMRANQFLVTFTDLAAAEAARRIASCLGRDVEVLDQIPGRAIFLLRVNGGAGRLLSAYRDRCFGAPETDGGLVIEPNRIVRLFSNQHGLDPAGSLPWYFRNNGGPGASADADMDGAESISRFVNERREPHEALRPTVVAAIDSGIDVRHPALAPALWINSAEVPGNGVDDDRNGYRDDINGWNFGDDNPNLADPLGHGTHVAGIIAARPAPGGSVRGIAPATSVMMLRITVGDPVTTEFLVTKAIYYAIAQRVDVITMSFGSPLQSETWDRAFEEAWRSGILLVAAAGNSASNIDRNPVFPCLSVAVTCVVATDPNDERASFSNWSDTRDLVGAPGVDIQSTLPGGRYGPLSGTSMAAPLVAGTLAAIKSLWPDLSPGRVLGRLVTAVDRPERLSGTGAAGVRLNAYRALYGGARSYGFEDGYCNETVQLPHGGGLIRRWQNYPYANSGDRGADGMSLATAHTICTGRQLLSISESDLEKTFLLRTHIDFAVPTHTDGNQIGAYVHPGGTSVRPFNGILDGGGFELRNYGSAGRPAAGLFAELGSHAFVTNLRFTRARLSSTGSAGAVATVSRGRLFNVQVEGTVAGRFNVGGLVGRLQGGSIGSSFFEGTVKGAGIVGGLAGSVEGAATRIADSFFQGRIEGSTAGGIVGDLHQGLLERSHAFLDTEPAAGARSVGGLAGVLRCRGRIADSYAEGRISADDEAGGLVGRLMDADLSSSYSAASVTGRANTGGAVGIRQDGLKVQIDPGAPVTYYCTGTATRPPPSAVLRTYYDSTVSPAGAAGDPRTSAQLRQASSFAGWSEENWLFKPNFMPALRQLPRTQLSIY